MRYHEGLTQKWPGDPVDTWLGPGTCDWDPAMIALGRVDLLSSVSLPKPAETPHVFGPALRSNAMTRRSICLGFVACLFVLALALRGQCADPPAAASDSVKPGFVPNVTIDAGKTREPISKYIYGQFIEHLGRCIYGGIWAEMLEDRKFFLPVGSKDSPWKPIGRAEDVTMDKEHPFVGAHSPKIALLGGGAAAGIAQGELALRKGKKYIGRIWLAGTQEAQLIKVSLVWGDAPDQRETIAVKSVTPEYAKTPLSFTALADTDQGRLEISSTGKGSFHVGTVSLMPADNVQGMRADTLALLRRLDSPVYRWPGGNFVSGYNWKDGIGDPDRRPPRKNPAWLGIEHNDFGMDEFMVFCKYLSTEPYIAVNSGLGDAQSAVEELQYANGGKDTPGGSLRAKNGHAEPYGVHWWSIGNEMFGDWQLGYMSQDKYTKKHNEFAKALRAADPSIKLIAVGAVGPWSEGMFRHCADSMDLMSEHFYCAENPGDLVAHVRLIANDVKRIATAHRDYRKQIDALKGKDIRVAMDEWNYWYGGEPYGQIGCPFHLKDALGIAAGLHEFFRQSDIIFMANYAQTVNVIGAIKTTKTAACLDTTGLVLELYRRHFGVTPVAVNADAPLDVSAAWSADHKKLTIGVVNPTPQKLDISLKIAGAKLKGNGCCMEIFGKDPMDHNAPGKEPPVKSVQKPLMDVKDRLSVKPLSVTLFVLDAE